MTSDWQQVCDEMFNQVAAQQTGAQWKMLGVRNVMQRWRQRARQLKRLVHALAIAARDPRTPLVAKVLAVIVVGYALSPIDLISDPIPILGYLDDLILIPLGIALAIRLIPAPVWSDAQTEAHAAGNLRPGTGRVAAVTIVVLWLILAFAGVLLLRRWL